MKKFLCAVLLFAAAYQTHLFAQAPVDLFDPFYDDLSIWEGSGLINDAPSIRPYPLQEIERLLQIVIEKGDAGQRRKAAEYQARFFQRAFHVGGKTEFNFASRGSKKQFFITPFGTLNYSVMKFLTISAYLSVNVMNTLDNETLLPAYSYSQKDIADDAGNIGKLKILPAFNTSATFGTAEYYFTAGLGRTSYGPFHDSGIFISRDAFHAGHFILAVNKKKWAYNQVLLLLSATNDYKTGIGPQKFIASHSIDIRPLSWLSFSIIDTMSYGGRFEPMYLIPFSAFFLGQSVYHFPDNSLIGLSATIKPVKGLRFDSAFYVDDLGLNEVLKFTDARFRIAGEFGVSYTMPNTHWFSFVDLNYTLVMPYMYTHVDDHNQNKPNYQNYTHHGAPLGTNLDPNSDRIYLKLKFRPLYGFDIDISDTFIRHANTTESIADIGMIKDYLERNYTTDGSVFNHPTITSRDGANGSTVWKNHAFLYATPFMQQKTIQYINQLAFDVSCHLPIVKSGGYMLFKLGYVFETNINPGVRNNVYLPSDTSKGWANKSIADIGEAEIRKEAARQLENWRANAKGKQFNHYIRLSAEVAY
ncbi:MAG: hypothetical protein ACTTJ4_07910 [Treponema sp.]|uniref:hypothetical protein n=1 Tax=Treponema sp. TaxID=166 RepID=UPI003FA1F63E